MGGTAGAQPGMVALEAVCKHFGNEVHPESEWIYMQKEKPFEKFRFEKFQGLTRDYYGLFTNGGTPNHPKWS